MTISNRDMRTILWGLPDLHKTQRVRDVPQAIVDYQAALYAESLKARGLDVIIRKDRVIIDDLTGWSRGLADRILVDNLTAEHVAKGVTYDALSIPLYPINPVREW